MILVDFDEPVDVSRAAFPGRAVEVKVAPRLQFGDKVLEPGPPGLRIAAKVERIVVGELTQSWIVSWFRSRERFQVNESVRGVGSVAKVVLHRRVIAGQEPRS